MRVGLETSTSTHKENCNPLLFRQNSNSFLMNMWKCPPTSTFPATFATSSYSVSTHFLSASHLLSFHSLLLNSHLSSPPSEYHPMPPCLTYFGVCTEQTACNMWAPVCQLRPACLSSGLACFNQWRVGSDPVWTDPWDPVGFHQVPLWSFKIRGSFLMSGWAAKLQLWFVLKHCFNPRFILVWESGAKPSLWIKGKHITSIFKSHQDVGFCIF